MEKRKGIEIAPKNLQPKSKMEAKLVVDENASSHDDDQKCRNKKEQAPVADAVPLQNSENERNEIPTTNDTNLSVDATCSRNDKKKSTRTDDNVSESETDSETNYDKCVETYLLQKCRNSKLKTKTAKSFSIPASLTSDNEKAIQQKPRNDELSIESSSTLRKGLHERCCCNDFCIHKSTVEDANKSVVEPNTTESPEFEVVDIR